MSDRFGGSVDIFGDYTIVGASLQDAEGADAGAAYVFWRTGTNSWDPGIKLTAHDAEAVDYFGSSVAISDDYAIVGASHQDAEGADAGAAYVFWRTGTNSWDPGIKLTAHDAEAVDYFGSSVAISDDYAIVGVSLQDAEGADAGAAYVFWRTGTNSWDSSTKLTAPDAQAGDRFGYSVAISGDYVVVGTFGEDAGGNDAGAAYVFKRTGTNSWDSSTKLTAPDAQAGDRFGYSVAISGDYVVVGAHLEDAEGDGAGAAYVFRLTGANSWDTGAKLTTRDAKVGDNFGASVALSGDYIIVGAPAGGLFNAGAAYVFRIK